MSDWDKEIKVEGHRTLTRPCSDVLWLTAALLFAYQHGTLTQSSLCNWLTQLWQVDLEGKPITGDELDALLVACRKQVWRLLK